MSLALLLMIVPGHAQVSVNGSGGANYNLSIPVPPGIAGMAPNLALHYSGGSVNGPVGLGWSVQGISLISRCPADKRLDGRVRTVEYLPDDKLCLDGQRLIQTDANGTPMADQSGDSLGGTTREYRTEKDMYARIRSYSAGGSIANGGPTYFKVWTKAGQIFEYGIGANIASQARVLGGTATAVIAAWPVSRVTDTVGNYMDFNYEQREISWGSGFGANTPAIGREWNVREILYTGNIVGGVVPTNRIVFDYADRADPRGMAQDSAEAYHRGGKTVSIRRLSVVRTYVSFNGTAQSAAVAVKSFHLAYDKGPTSARSRLAQLTECAGAAAPGTAGAKCLPPTKFGYSPGGGVSYTVSQTFRSGPLATLPMRSKTGQYGILTGDFLGTGRTDILRWGDDANNNVLYSSNGDGNFTGVSGFNLRGQRLFSADGCYAATVADFNGDGLSDILRTMQTRSGCPQTKSNLLFLAQGGGTFSTVTVPATINLDQLEAKTTTHTPCPPDVTCQPEDPSYSRTEGKTYHVLDVDGDGILDIVTTILPGHARTTQPPVGDASVCAGIICTRVFRGTTTGGFIELTGLQIANRSMYATPSSGLDQPRYYQEKPFVADVDGDGLSDLLVDGGRWISKGTGDFSLSQAAAGYESCAYPIDFNGDGRVDCLHPDSNALYQALEVADGSYISRRALTSNISDPAAGLELLGYGRGISVADMDGDGRTDILRWRNDPSQNMVFLSNGDSTFRRGDFNLTSASDILQKTEGDVVMIVGDFTGRGNAEILRIVENPSTTSEVSRSALYLKTSPAPPDQLVSVLTPSGLSTALHWVPLSNPAAASLGERYASDRGTAFAATYPTIDLQLPSYVVATTDADTGTGTRLATEYSYIGLKASHDGRGQLGFREMRQQQIAPHGGPITIITTNLQLGEYIGVASGTETRLGTLNAPGALLSRSAFIYCDKTSPVSGASASAELPCVTTAKVRRPYLYKSIEEGWDLDGTALPTVATTNDFNDSGDPLAITINTSGRAVAGLTQTFVKTTTNEYYPNTVSGDTWILGRLKKATATSTVPNDLDRIVTVAGSAPLATATSGGGPAVVLSRCSAISPTTAPTPATLTCGLKNSGNAAWTSITYTYAMSGSGVSVTGPTGPCAPGATCGVVTVTTGTEAGLYQGTFTATPNTGAAASMPLGIVVKGNTLPATLSLSCPASGSSTAPNPATVTCSLSNVGGAAAGAISYTTTGNLIVSGPVGACSAGAVCGTVNVRSSGTTAGAYGGRIIATPNAGTASFADVSLTINTAVNPPALVLSCPSSGTGIAGSFASVACTLRNNGGSTAGSISYSATGSISVSGPLGACAAGASCGTVTVRSNGTAIGSYSGRVTATPSTGNASAADLTLTVIRAPTPVALDLVCPTTGSGVAPNSAAVTCTLMNNGEMAATSISYTTTGTIWAINGPTSCAGSSSCGTLRVVSNNTLSGTYSGTVTAVPNSGSGDSASVTLTLAPIPTPVRLSLSCPSSVPATTSPTPASMSCTISNLGETGATWLAYSTAIAGANISGPTGACSANSTCGTVVVTTGSASGTYSGNISAVASSGMGDTQSVSLTVNPPAVSTTTLTQPGTLNFNPVFGGIYSNASFTIRNTGSVAATGLSITATVTEGSAGDFGWDHNCGTSLAAGASCTVSMTYEAFCQVGRYGKVQGVLNTRGTNFSALQTTLFAETREGICM